MLKGLITLFLAIALSVGIAVINGKIENDSNVNQDDVHITESTQNQTTEPTLTEPATEEPTTGETVSGDFEAEYTYDLLGRLIKAEYELYILEYEYDKNGNILKIDKILK